MLDNIFREYDIRGLADTELTNSFAWSLGRSLGERLVSLKEKCVYIGQDVRSSSPRLADALAAGLESIGAIQVIKLAPGPTPLLYFCAEVPYGDFSTSSGIMVTGSHNPAEFNGFKMVLKHSTLFGHDIQELKNAVIKHLPSAPQNIITKALTLDRSREYVAYIKNNIKLSRPLKVVVDAGNGAAGELGVKTYEALGCEVVPLFCEADGSFPNHHPDPTVPQNLVDLIQKVKSTHADLGIAFDGDGDRIGAVTSSGRILFGDQLVLYFSRDILKEVPGATIISEVKSSQVLYDTLQKWGAHGILWKTGHSLMKAKLRETGAMLAGEMSGHIFFSHRYLGFDDAIYAGARLLEGLASRPEESLDVFLNSLPQAINTPEIRVACPDEKKFIVVHKMTAHAKKLYGDDVNDIDGARIKMLGGWGLVRASNTQPVLVFRFEAPTFAILKNIQQNFQDMLRAVDTSIHIPGDNAE